jgi:hypothetical protein
MIGFSLRRLLVGAVAAGAALMVAGTALAQPLQTPIGKKQYFAGQVNGNFGSSVLSVVGCPVPTAATASTGRGTLLPGQTVSALRFVVPPPVAFGSHFLGYTGAAHKISADLDVAFLETPLIQQIHIADLTTYNAPAMFPVGLSVPCNATFTMVFTPINGGANALDSVVNLTLGDPTIVVGPTVIQPAPAPVLHGSGFAPNSTYTVAECSKTSWIVPQDPCVNTNSVTVTTSTTGTFTHAITAAPCSPALLATCYVGVPLPFGIDTVQLVGAAPITVL